jgi:hypothetical protein
VVVYGDVEGERIEGKAFDFPITLCLGCQAISFGDCAALGEDFEPVVDPGAACFPGQNGRISCCTSGGSLICPAPTN